MPLALTLYVVNDFFIGVFYLIGVCVFGRAARGPSGVVRLALLPEQQFRSGNQNNGRRDYGSHYSNGRATSGPSIQAASRTH
jgi:hypothetical protein